MEFRKRLYGYDVNQVNESVDSLKQEYEKDLALKQARLDELTNENRLLIAKIEELNAQLLQYRDNVQSVALALISAQETAKQTIEDAQKKKREEIDRLSTDVKKWEARGEQVRAELIEFEEAILDIMEKYQSEVNYLASKDVKRKYFSDHAPSKSEKTA
ncbi:MAG: hypothetical protein E7312_02225 [Clostridiales bacterium]|nr:hypothetical protein [Clostridiales bacterium]